MTTQVHKHRKPSTSLPLGGDTGLEEACKKTRKRLWSWLCDGVQIQDAGFRRHFLLQCLILIHACNVRSTKQQELFKIKQVSLETLSHCLHPFKNLHRPAHIPAKKQPQPLWLASRVRPVKSKLVLNLYFKRHTMSNSSARDTYVLSDAGFELNLGIVRALSNSSNPGFSLRVQVDVQTPGPLSQTTSK